MRRSTGFRRFPTLAVGFVLGFVVGSATLSGATFGRTGWERFGPMFKQGYVAGFVECVRIAKGLDPFSYIATQFPVPVQAKPTVWMRTIDELYAQDAHKNRTLPQIMIIAGSKLHKQFGTDEIKPGDARLEQLREAIDRQRKALLQARKTVQAAESELKKDGEKAAAASAAAKNAAGPVGEKTEAPEDKGQGAKPAESQGDAAKPEGAADEHEAQD